MYARVLNQKLLVSRSGKAHFSERQNLPLYSFHFEYILPQGGLQWQEKTERPCRPLTVVVFCHLLISDQMGVSVERLEMLWWSPLGTGMPLIPLSANGEALRSTGVAGARGLWGTPKHIIEGPITASVLTHLPLVGTWAEQWVGAGTASHSFLFIPTWASSETQMWWFTTTVNSKV